MPSTCATGPPPGRPPSARSSARASRIDELRETLPAAQELRLSLVFDVLGDGAHAALRSCAADDRLTVVGVEAALAKLGDDALAVGANLARLPGATGFLEVPRTGFEEALDLVGSSGWHAAKYRTGGVTADAFPAEPELAAFLVACAGRRTPFKLTAGLHHAVRSTTDDGLEQHGLLNVLVGTRVALTGGGSGRRDGGAGGAPDRAVGRLRAGVGRRDLCRACEPRSGPSAAAG